MVRTRARGDAPAELVRHAAAWTRRWKRIAARDQRGDWATKLAKQVLRGALTPLTHGKCAYCEGLLDAQSETGIEHYWPKSLRQDLAFDWPNLLPACRMCNGAKAETDHGGDLLKPDEEDPEPYFWIHPDTGALEPHPALDEKGTLRAQRTIEICDLQRAALCTQRIGTLRRVGRWVERMADESPNARLRAEWDEISHPQTERKLVIRYLLERRGLSELAQSDRARFAATSPR